MWFNTHMRGSILGIGPTLRGNDSAGMEIVRDWKASHPDHSSSQTLELEVMESQGLSLLTLVSEYQAAFLVDAVQSGAEPASCMYSTPGTGQPSWKALNPLTAGDAEN